MTRRGVRAFLLCATVIVSACGQTASPGPAAAPEPSPPADLVIGIPEGAPVLDPFSSTTAAWQSLTASTIEQLVYFDSDKPGINPGLARSWRFVDPTTLELVLRQDVKFTNGEAFDADAAKYSVDLLMKAKPYSTFTGSMASVEIVDRYTVRIKAKEVSGLLLPALARGGYVYPPKYHREKGEAFGKAPIGTGPYKVTTYEKGSQLVLEGNADYWGGKPTYAKIVWRIIPEEAARVAALKTGEVQLVTNLSAASQGQITADPSLAIVKRQGLRQFASFFDALVDGPVKSKQVRQALNYAIDKDALVKLFGGEATPLQGQWLTSGVPGFNTDLKPYPYDPKKARELLAAAGYPNGFETSLSYTIDRYALDKEMGQAVAGYLEAIGLKVKQNALPYAKFQPDFRGGVGKLGPIFQWGLLSPPDPEMTLGNFVKGSDYRRFPDGGEVDRLLTAGGRETDPQKRADIYRQLLAIWYDDPIGIYLVVPNDLYGTRKGLKGFSARQDQVLFFDVKKSQ